MRNKWLWMVIGLVLLVAGGFALKSRLGKGRDRGGAGSKVTVEQGSIKQTVEATGEVSPLNRVEVKPPISGRIEKLLVEEGDRVRAGSILAWMSSSDRAAILDAARAKGPEELQKWSDSYKATPIVAPLSGVIILKNVVVGQTVDPSAILYAMSDKLTVLAQVDEADIGRVKLGMPARITLDAYPDQPVEGKVFQVLYEGKNVSNVITYGVKVEPLKVPAFFRSQMTANVSFVLQSKENVLLVPAAAVQEKGGEKQVWIPGPDGKPVSKGVEVGIETGEQVEIVSGLSAGDTVIIKRTRYVPQQAPQSSPLASGGGGGGSGGRRQGRQ